MLRNVLVGHSLAAVLALTSIGCGQKKENPEPPSKKGLLTQPPNPTTNAVVGLKDPIAAPAATGIYAQVPSGVTMVFALNKPEQTIALGKDLAKRFGADIEADSEFKKNREEFKTKLGVDILDPELFKKVGIDASQGIAVAVDTNAMVKKARPLVGAAATEISQNPVVFLVAALSSGETFDKIIRETITKEKPDTRFEDVTLGEKDKLTFMYQTKTVGEAKVETLKTAFAQQGGYLYVFLNDEIQKIDDPAAGNPIEDYKTTVKTYLEKKSGSISTDGGFTSLTKKLDPQSNMFFYMDFSKLISMVEAGDKTILYSAPKDEQEKATQLAEKSAQEERKVKENKENDNMKKVAKIVPQLGFSFSMTNDRLAMKGSATVAPESQNMIQKALVPEIDAPAYATIFPENTTLLFRSSLSFGGIKDMVFSLMPDDEKLNAAAGYAEAKKVLLDNTGLDLDADLFGGLTGHLAFGAESAEVFTKFAQEVSTKGMPSSLPKFMMVSQFSSAEVGDKLLAKIEELVSKNVGAGFVKSEDVNGDKLYTITFGPFVGAWARSGLIFLLATDAGLIKESLARIKTPGASFAEKLSPLAKSLATDKNASGLTIGLGSLLAAITELPDTSPSDKEMLVKLSAVLNKLTMDSSYEAGLIHTEYEMTLK
jgi:hypothetical protein